MDYRKEIDGLRAIAILPVVLFHSGLPYFNWGYVGVDIFFVISGFLITSIIFPKIEKNEFSYLWFYENRVRRLLPALFLMVFLSTLTALFLLNPIQLKEFSYSIFSAIFFYSNFFFWQEIDYFESNSELMPFLHTWSLSIEEQFYIFFPIILMIIVKTISKHLLLIIVFFTFLSLALWVYGNIFFQTATFYLPITRAWELLAGSILAIYIHKYGFLKYKFLSTLGLLILFISFYFFSSEDKLKNLFMIFPVIGTLLILSVKKHYSIVQVLLMNKVSIFFGLISYSLYLFHQPIFAFAKIYFLDLALIEILSLTIISIIVSYISWKYIESNFRKRFNSQISFKSTLFILGAPLLLSLIIASYSISTNGNKNNYIQNLKDEPLQTYNLLEKIKYENEIDESFSNGECIININNLGEYEQNIILGCNKKYGKGVLIFGDSHSKDIFNSIAPLLNTDFVIGLSRNFCQLHIDTNSCFYNDLKRFLDHNSNLFSKIIFNQAGYFFLNIDGKNLNDKSLISNISVSDETAKIKIISNRIASFLRNIEVFPDSLIVLGPKKELHIQTKYIEKYGCNSNYSTRKNFDDAFKELDEILNKEFSSSKKTYISLQEAININLEVDFINCKSLFWSDGDHWSSDGEARFGSRIISKITNY